jgi:hypothetical protein
MKKESNNLEHPICNLTGGQCHHCSEETTICVGGYCVLKTGETVRTVTRPNLGQMCNCESKWVSDLDHCPLEDCIRLDDTWQDKLEKKPNVGQQVLL